MRSVIRTGMAVYRAAAGGGHPPEDAHRPRGGEFPLLYDFGDDWRHDIFIESVGVHAARSSCVKSRLQNISLSSSPGWRIPQPTTLVDANRLNQIRLPVGKS